MISIVSEYFLSPTLQAYRGGVEWASDWDEEHATDIQCRTPQHMINFDILALRPNDFTCAVPEIEPVTSLNVTAYSNQDNLLQVQKYMNYLALLSCN